MFSQDRSSPLLVESLRQSLACQGELDKLKETYKSKPELPNRNTPEFWDELLVLKKSLEDEGPMTRERIKIALGFIPKKANKILDVGAGYGFVEELIQKKNKRERSLYGIDISPKGIEQIKSKFRGKFRVGDVRAIPYLDNSFNVVLALEVLEHIPPSDVFKALRELKRVLKPDGVLIVSVPTNEAIADFSKNPSGHLRIYTPELIKAELLLAGFKFIQWKKLYAFNKWYGLKSILASLVSSKFLPNNVIIKARKPAEPKSN